MSGERGGATLLAAAVLGLVVWLGVLTVELAVALDHRIALGTAADAAALAAVGAAVEGADPVAAAGRLARANGASLTACRCPAYRGLGYQALVGVSTAIELPLIGVRRIEATASAEYDGSG